MGGGIPKNGNRLVATQTIQKTKRGVIIYIKIPCNEKNYTKTKTKKEGIIIHYTANKKDTAYDNGIYFQRENKYHVSANIIIDEKDIVESVPIQYVAHHCGTDKGYKTWARNSNSIGIEMCTSGNFLVSKKTQRRTATYTAELCKQLGIKVNDVDKKVLRHYDVGKNNKPCPAQYVSYPEQFKQFKAWVKEDLAKLYGEVKKPTTTTTTAVKNQNFKVKVTCDVLNIRKQATTSSAITGTVKKNEVYTIVETKNGFYKLKSGAGWISSKYVKKV